jgi:hypothetical protein
MDPKSAKVNRLVRTLPRHKLIEVLSTFEHRRLAEIAADALRLAAGIKLEAKQGRSTDIEVASDNGS